ncbi:MAG TPA: hypothetical protein VGN89_15210 [Phenylobacterium sp.]|jgi:hypothetical protein|nr:hypothetical protein [Phenylobacterium sp.]
MIARLQTLGIVLILLAVASIPTSIGVSTWLERQRMRDEWTAVGPACPIVVRATPANRGAKPPRPFVYKGVGFAYQIGDVSCVAAPEKGLFNSRTYPICQFDAPGAIAVTAGGHTTLFEPGIGHSATVTVQRGRASCVIGGGLRAGERL